jgi:flagellar protein FlbD
LPLKQLINYEINYTTVKQGTFLMITLTRLNGQPITLNPDQILWLEANPDTVVTLLNGEKLVLKDSIPSIRTAFIAFKREIQSGLEGV